jgi:hypothetical protein
MNRSRRSQFPVPSPRSFRLVLIVFPLVCFWLASEPARVQAQSQETGGVQIQVRVTDQDNGSILDGVRLELVRFPDGILQTIFTDGAGRGQFTPVPAQDYHIRASTMGYQPAEVFVDPGMSPRGSTTSYFAEVQMRRAESSDLKAPGGKVGVRELSLPPGAVAEFKKGIELLSEKKDPKGSIEHFQKAIDAAPNYYEAYYLLGMAALQSNGAARAVTALQKAVELNAKFMEPYYPLSSALHLLGRDSEAIAVLTAARELDPTGWRWPFELARMCGNHQEWDKAMSMAKEAAAKQGVPPKVHVLLADLYSNTGQPQKALEELELFAKLDPSSPLMPRVTAAIAKLKQS